LTLSRDISRPTLDIEHTPRELLQGIHHFFIPGQGFLGLVMALSLSGLAFRARRAGFGAGVFAVWSREGEFVLARVAAHGPRRGRHALLGLEARR